MMAIDRPPSNDAAPVLARSGNAAPTSDGGTVARRCALSFRQTAEKIVNLSSRWRALPAVVGNPSSRCAISRRAAFILRHSPFVIFLLLLALAASAQSPWRLALPGWQYEFPRDHQPHPEFKTEWWYFTGNLRDGAGREFGYQLTFFRQGLRPPSARGGTASRLIMDDLPFAHFAISDPAATRFVFQQKLSRGVLGEAGFGEGQRIAWIGDWQLTMDAEQGYRLRAAAGDAMLDLELRNAKSTWAIHGTDGISQKASGEGHASHYYSGTRMATRGALTLGGRRMEVTGESWFDHEWATNQLTAEQAGWNWFSIQLDDGTELMFYQMRLRDGSLDPHSSGTWIDAAGAVQHLAMDDYRLTPTRFWTSKETGVRYPIAWQLETPGLGLSLAIETPLPAQELALKSIAYWEGMIGVTGTRAGRDVRGHGYMELTGYAGALAGLSSPE